MAWSPPETFANNEIVTATKLNTNIRDNMREVWREIAYVEFTSGVTLASGSDSDIVSSGAITYTAEPILIEFFSPSVLVPDATSGELRLFDGATNLGTLATVQTQDATSGSLVFPAHLGRRLTPTAASHTYKIAGRGASVVVGAGAGGAGVTMPGYIRILQKGSA
jgi:hypothetical protein